MDIKCAILTWDWKDNPDAEQLSKANRQVFTGNFAPSIAELPSESGDCGLIFSSQPLTKQQIRQVMDTWLKSDREIGSFTITV